MNPDDQDREEHFPFDPLPITIIDAGEGRPPMPPSKGHAEHVMNMLPTLVLDASDSTP